MGPVARNPVFGIPDKLRLKPACSATETSLMIENSCGTRLYIYSYHTF